MSSYTDVLQKFMFEDLPVKGSFVRLELSWQEVLRRAQPDALAVPYLGDTLSAAALLTSNIKFKGSVQLQIQSSGLVRLLMGQCSHDGKLRGIARLNEAPPANAGLVEQAVLAINLSPAQGSAPYQGIVGISDQGLIASLEQYFRQSEQLETRFWLASDAQGCSGLMLQRMPGETLDGDGWNRLQLLADSVSPAELQSLSAEKLLHILFHQESLRLFPPAELQFSCTCTHKKVSGMLQSLGEAEVMDIVEQRGEVEVNCEHCGKAYTFDRVDAARLFTSQDVTLSTDSHLH